MENTKELLIKALDASMGANAHDKADFLLKQFEIKPIDPKQELRDEVNDILSTYVDFVPSGMIGAVMEAVDKYVATIQPKQPETSKTDLEYQYLTIVKVLDEHFPAMILTTRLVANRIQSIITKS